MTPLRLPFDERDEDVAIRAVVFDIGGILEIIPEGGDPTARFPQLIERWETRLGMAPGALGRQLRAVRERLEGAGKDREIGTCSEAEWIEELRQVTGWDPPRIDAFMRDHWDVYCGTPNVELAAYLGSLRPHYKTALLSNSGVGARREEEARYHFSQLVDCIIYSHEVGIAKPDQRIYAIACERLGVSPEEVVFLDDAERNIAAAAAHGLHAICFRDNPQAIADIQTCLLAHSADGV
ncbi:MAG TPA: HAD family phosphatase [Ktedonobacterales bacterium]|nr:HAD family phosphatase [Ktedonobacterales bacterium]